MRFSFFDWLEAFIFIFIAFTAGYGHFAISQCFDAASGMTTPIINIIFASLFGVITLSILIMLRRASHQ